MTEPDDTDRLIQDVLAELGWASDARRIADKVRQLDRGLPAEDEFMAVCAWLGQTRLIHKLDQHQSPPASRETYQVPDLLADFQSSGPVLIEVKVKRSQTLSFTPEYLGRLNAYPARCRRPVSQRFRAAGEVAVILPIKPYIVRPVLMAVAGPKAVIAAVPARKERRLKLMTPM